MRNIHDITQRVHSGGPHQVDVTELVQPEGVDGRGDAGEVVGLEARAADPHRRRQPGQDPPVHRALLAAQLLTGGTHQSV